MASAPNISTSKSKTILINGIDRSWEYFRERSIIMWTGALPDVSTIQLKCMFLPADIYVRTPVVILHIDAAGGHDVSVTFTRVQSGNAASVWHEWKPVVEHIPTFATPWTIKLYDYSNTMLDMGSDGVVIQDICTLSNRKTRLTFAEPFHTSVGHTLILKKPNDAKRVTCSVANIVDNSVVVDGLIADISADASSSWMACDTCSQAHIILEYVI